MSVRATAGALLLASLVSACAGFAPGGPTYTNPVLARDFADPAVLRAPDGWFFAYATQTPHGRMLNIQVARSRDLVQWQHLGDALPDKPRWAANKQNFWAPHVIYDAQQEKYFMYYSAEPDNARGKCLAVAVARAAAGPFVDSGEPLLCGKGHEHIDPMAFDDPQSGRRLLYWGSGFWPIRVQELAADRLRFAPGTAPTPLVFPDKQKEYRELIEGAWVTRREGFYYLFYSGDRCCERRPRYAVMVARARSPLGPFEEYPHAILRNNGFWIAPGHNSVVTDDAGDDWILYHAIDAEGDHLEEKAAEAWRSARVMLLDRLVYHDGWPRVAGDQPSVTPHPGPAWRNR